MSFTYLRDPSGTQVVEFSGVLSKAVVSSMLESNWTKATTKEFEVFTKEREALLAVAPAAPSGIVTAITLQATAPGDIHKKTGRQLPPTVVTSKFNDGPVVSGTVV
jgi:hypothetical protein